MKPAILQLLRRACFNMNAPLVGGLAILGAGVAAQGAPAILTSAGLRAPSGSAATVGIVFDRNLDPVSAAVAGNYSLNNGAAVQGAQLLPDSRTVVLTVNELPAVSYTLTVNGVKDTANDPAANLTTTVQVLNYTAATLQGDVAITNVLQYATSPTQIVAEATGGDSWYSDSIAYTWREIAGDFDVKVQSVSVENAAHGDARMSLDVRNSLSPAAPHLAVATFTGRSYWGAWLRETEAGPASVLWFNYPAGTGDWVVSYPDAGMDLPNNWLRIRRVGNIFTTFAGTNGINWNRVGNHYIGTNMASTVLVGLATASGNGGPAMRVKYSTITDYAYANGAIGIVAQPQGETVNQLEPVTFSVQAVLTNGAADDLIYEWRSNGVAIVKGPYSSYTIASAPVSANGSSWTVSIIAPGVAPVVSAPAVLGVMLQATPPQVLSVAGLPGGNMAGTIGLRFDKSLDQQSATDVTHYVLNNGATVQSATLLPDGKSVMLSVDQLPGSSYTLIISGVRDAALNPALNTSISVPVIRMTAQTLEGSYFIGSSMGYAFITNVINAQVAGGDSWNPDSINYIYREFSGDFDVRVQCAGVTNGGSGDARLSLDVRDSVDPSSRHVGVAMFPGRAYWGSWYRNSAGSSSVLWGGPNNGEWFLPYPAEGMNLPNNWLRVRRVGSTITTFASTNGTSWVRVGGHFTDAELPATMLVGLASGSGAGSSVMTGEYANFGNFSYAGTSAAIGITSQPESKAVTQLQPVSFSVSAVLTNGNQGDLIYEWRSNGVMVARGPASSYNIPIAPLTANNSTWTVVVSAPGIAAVTSAPATLSVVANMNPPAILSAAALRTVVDAPTVGLVFDKLLDPQTASDPANYVLNNGATVTGAQLLLDGKTVLLTVSELTAASYTVTVSGIRDIALNPPLNGSFPLSVMPLTGTTIRGIYSMTASGAVASSTNSISVQVAGGDSWFPDTVNYVYVSVTNDFDIRVQWTRVINGSHWDGRVSLGARDTLDAASRHVAIGAFPTRGYWGSWVRNAEGAASVLWTAYPNAGGDWLLGFPPAGANLPNNWLRIRREGASFTTYAGTNGVDWAQVGGAFVDALAPSVMLVGMETASGNDQVNMFAEYANFGQAVVRPTLSLHRAGANLKVLWSGGTLQSSTTANGLFTDVQVTGNTYEFSPSGTQRFFRVRQ